MRIIAGKYKGKKLKVPKTDLRPTTNVVREALFDIIGDKIIGSAFLDIFAGSGLVGLEALSRGAKTVSFVEKSKVAGITIKENIKTLNANGKVYTIDFRKFLKHHSEKYDYIFFSPPYFEKYEYDILKYLEISKVLDDKTLIIIQIYKKVDLPLSDFNFKVLDERRYGITKLIFLKKENNLQKEINIQNEK